jgi:hypothetical protein
MKGKAIIFFSSLRIYILILVLFSCCSCNTRFLGSDFTSKEKWEIRRCNTGRFNLVMNRRSQEIIRLCNLARRNPALLKKYVTKKYGEEYGNRTGISLAFKSNKNIKKPFLRPSYLLWFAAKSHAIVSGLTAYEGHRGMFTRMLVFGNFNVALPGILSGENCCYGYYQSIDAFMGWMESGGHRANIMDEDFYRIGIGGSLHFSQYRYNIVQCFSGPKVFDVLLRPQTVFTKKSKRKGRH